MEPQAEMFSCSWRRKGMRLIKLALLFAAFLAVSGCITIP
jgi:hypothetical protein